MMTCPECKSEMCDFSPDGAPPNFICLECGEPESTKYNEKFKNVLDEVYNLARGQKTNDYGETWKRSGLKGIYIKLMIKEGRLRELIWEGKTPQVKGERLRDTLLDTAAYSIYGILCLDEGNLDGAASRLEHLENMNRAIAQEIKNLKEEVDND